MTKTADMGEVTVIWPERDSLADYEYDHAITVRVYGSSTVEICGIRGEVGCPVYALDALIAALRAAKKTMAERGKR
jgi:hypothetical protein